MNTAEAHQNIIPTVDQADGIASPTRAQSKIDSNFSELVTGKFKVGGMNGFLYPCIGLQFYSCATMLIN